MELANQKSFVIAAVVLYDKALFHPTPRVLFNLIDRITISLFGMGTKIIESAEKFNLKPKKRALNKKKRTIVINCWL